jgi:hypothetical protein
MIRQAKKKDVIYSEKLLKKRFMGLIVQDESD